MPSRRDFLTLGAVPLQMLDAAPYQFRVFSPAERSALRILAARIVPAGERSGGAASARVEEYVDWVVSNGNEAQKQRWRDGLTSMRLKMGHASDEEVDRLLTRLSRNEFAPATPDEEFFVMLKGAIVEAFYTSEEGITKELGYQGLQFHHHFEGCTHESHESPASHVPALKSRS